MDKPLYSQFKAVTAHEAPKLSDVTETQIGKFKKAKNQTYLRWKESDNLEYTPSA